MSHAVSFHLWRINISNISRTLHIVFIKENYITIIIELSSSPRLNTLKYAINIHLTTLDVTYTTLINITDKKKLRNGHFKEKTSNSNKI